MSVQSTTTDELRRKVGKEGLILQDCGGNLNDWLDGINDLFTKEGLLLDGTKFEKCESFNHNGSTNLYFPFEDDVKLNMGKLAIWRIATHGNFGGTWLSDYVENKLGGFIKEEQKQKPDCPLIGQGGNIFNLMGIASRTLRRNGMSNEAAEMTKRITNTAKSYYDALDIIGEYVNITSVDEDEDIDEYIGLKQ